MISFDPLKLALALIIILTSALRPDATCADPEPTTLVISLADYLPKPGLRTTRRNEVQHFRSATGHTMHFTRSKGGNQASTVSVGFGWVQVQQMPARQDAITLTPTRTADGRIHIALAYQRSEGVAGEYYESTLILEPDKWVPVYANTSPSGGRAGLYSSASADEQLYIKASYQRGRH